MCSETLYLNIIDFFYGKEPSPDTMSNLSFDYDFTSALMESEASETAYKAFSLFNRMTAQELKHYLGDFRLVDLVKVFVLLLRPLTKILDKCRDEERALQRYEEDQTAIMIAQAVYFFEVLDEKTRETVVRFDSKTSTDKEVGSLAGLDLRSIFSAYPSIMHAFTHCLKPSDIAYVLYKDTHKDINEIINYLPSTLTSEMAYLLLLSPVFFSVGTTQLDRSKFVPSSTMTWKIFERASIKIIIDHETDQYGGDRNLEPETLLAWTKYIATSYKDRLVALDIDWASEKDRERVQEIVKNLKEWEVFYDKLTYMIMNPEKETKESDSEPTK